MAIRSLHLLVGIGGALAFLGTGAYMAAHFPVAQWPNRAAGIKAD